MSASEHNSSDTSATRWLLKYGDRIYGPYSQEAMSGYITEGRVVASSLIAPEGIALEDNEWLPASATTAFAEKFSENPKPQNKSAQNKVAPDYVSPADRVTEAKADTSEQKLSTTTESDTEPRPVYGPAKGQVDRRRQPETANFIVIMDIKARYAGPLEQAIMSLGPAYKLAPNVWCVNTNTTAPGLLNDLSIHIGKTDSMFIVDATRDRTAWHNLGPETDAKIRRVWRRAF
tara:strand:- start:9015 stop:9710 length:696 start_codon:yes stop_codon:yes gene_type:complete